MNEAELEQLARQRRAEIEPILDALHEEVTEAVDNTLRLYMLQQKAKGVDMTLSSFATGRALIMLGMTYAGVALGLECGPTLAIAEECLGKLRAERKKLRGNQFLQPPE